LNDMREAGLGVNPEQQSIETETAPQKRSKLLKHIKEVARTVVMVGVLGGLGAGTALAQSVEKRGAGSDFVQWYGQQHERVLKLESKEAQLQQRFGDNYRAISNFHKEALEREAERYKKSGSGQKYFRPVDSLSIALYELETDKTEKAETSKVDSAQGTMTAEELSEIIDKTFPKGWVNNEVGAIFQMGVDSVSGDQKGLGGGWVTLALIERAGYYGRKDRITLNADTNKKHLVQDIVNGTLAHEIGHANDWELDNEMNHEERADLLLSISERLSSEDRFQSNYVESINNADKQKESYLKAIEYWAEICGQYFQDPAQLHVKDFRIVSAEIRRTDPNFNWQEKNQLRRELIQKVIERGGNR